MIECFAFTSKVICLSIAKIRFPDNNLCAAKLDKRLAT